MADTSTDAIIDDLGEILRWWTSARAEPTSSLTGGGAIAVLERVLGELLCGHAVALPSGTSAIKAGVRVLDENGHGILDVRSARWDGYDALARSIQRRICVDTVTEPSVRIVDHTDHTEETGGTGGPSVLVDAANARIDGLSRLGSARWDALALSFGPGKAIDAGEGGAIVFRSSAHAVEAVRQTQHPIRQQLWGIPTPDADVVCERIHPIAAVIALYRLDQAGLPARKL